ncbi:MAG: hypothetical protein WBP93_02880 [Pyrinomonadaceae bacterium]
MPAGDWLLVNLKGPGIFLGAQVAQFGPKPSTVVNLAIDGRNVVSISYADATDSGFTQQNPYGIVLLGGKKSNLTIGFPSPLRFEKSLTLSVEVKTTAGGNIQASVVHGV